MWGLETAASAVLAKDFFVRHSVKNVLIPGIGYGRNARPFIEAGMQITGIEISGPAIELAGKYFGEEIKIHHGPVDNMPFDDKMYDAIFCHALIHLLDHRERAKLIRDCYQQLTDNGCMVFTTITKEAHTYGQGTRIDKDRFEMFSGVKMFFYDQETIREEFKEAGLMEVAEVKENYPFYLIKCRKKIS